jgi:hypothetical protein
MFPQDTFKELFLFEFPCYCRMLLMASSLPGETLGLHGVQFVQQWDIQSPFSLIIFLWGIRNARCATIKVSYISLEVSLRLLPW